MKKIIEFIIKLGINSVGQENKIQYKILHTIGGVILFFMFFAAFYYLFIFPYQVATKVFEDSIVSFLFAMFLFGQLWMLVVETAYGSLAQLYNLKRKYFFKFLHQSKTNTTTSKRIVFAKVMTSYLLLIYGFAIIYLYLSNYYPSSFESSPISFIKAIYFSSMAGTVGFSNINPTSDLSRVFVMIQVFICFLYSIIFFSLIASFIRENPAVNNPNNESDVLPEE